MNFKVIFIALSIASSEISGSNWKGWCGELDWWQNTILYQIFPRSFQDSDNDGSGDLKGIENRLNHLVESGIKTYWISPIYPSPMHDLGYDVTNFTAIHPLYGTMQDFKSLVAMSHKKGLKILLDFVPNHSSDECEWFKKSVERIDPYTDYYIWHDGKIVNGKRVVPNNWVSVFKGTAWEWNEKRGQYYLHHFHAKQAEFDFRNEDFLKELDKVLLFWLDLGVDGFRADAVNFLVEDAEFRDELLIDPSAPPIISNMYLNRSFHLPEDVELVKRWRKLLDEYSKKDGVTRILVSEAYGGVDEMVNYYGDEENLAAHLPFNFLPLKFLNYSSNATDFKENIDSWVDKMPEGAWPNWNIGNHDNERVATRLGEEMVDVMAIMTMLLPGTPVTYQGEEIGQTDTLTRQDQVHDQNKVGPLSTSRDPARGPFLWDDTKNAGFSNAYKAWLPVNPSYWTMNLEQQKKTSNSNYRIYQELSKLRQHETILRGTLDTYVISDWVFSFVRKLENNDTFVVIMNIGSELEAISLAQVKSDTITDLPQSLSVYIRSGNSIPKIGSTFDSSSGTNLMFRPKSALVLKSTKPKVEENKCISIGKDIISLLYDILKMFINLFKRV